MLPIHYRSYGVRGSALTVVPFNQGSKQGVEALVGEKFILVEVVSHCMLKSLS
jgi:3-oxoacyl-ACP reductase-like protein